MLAACRRLVFDELVGKAADRAAKEAKRAARAAEAFTALLRDTKAISQGMPWEEAHVLVASDRDYQAVGSLINMSVYWATLHLCELPRS
jgi:FF domain